MKRDSQPVSQQVISGLRIGAVLLIVALGVRIFSSYIPVHRIEAYIWHLRHGSTVDVAQYRLTAPKQWYVERVSEDEVRMVDLNTGDVVLAWAGGIQRSTVTWSYLVLGASATSAFSFAVKLDSRYNRGLMVCTPQRTFQRDLVT